MAYKRYVKRGGKVCGPYYYESYRDKSGKVKKRYVGLTNKKHFTILNYYSKNAFCFIYLTLTPELINSSSILIN